MNANLQRALFLLESLYRRRAQRGLRGPEDADEYAVGDAAIELLVKTDADGIEAARAFRAHLCERYGDVFNEARWLADAEYTVTYEPVRPFDRGMVPMHPQQYADLRATIHAEMSGAVSSVLGVLELDHPAWHEPTRQERCRQALRPTQPPPGRREWWHR